jgi:predicted permease
LIFVALAVVFATTFGIVCEHRFTGARKVAQKLIERPERPVLLVLGLRLIIAPLIVGGLSALIVHVPSAYLLQAAMPTGINSLIVGHAYGLDQRLIATIIVWSTATALVGGLVVSIL